MNTSRFLGEMRFYEDEPVAASPDDSGPKPKLRIMAKNMAPWEANKFKVVLELSGADRPGVDMVAVLDVTGSMKGERLDKLKNSMSILISKLSPMDRLSVITFSQKGICAKKTHIEMCRLRRMSKAARNDIEKFVASLRHVNDSINIADGLRVATQVLNSRNHVANRRAAIVLVSDGDPNRHTQDAAQVSFGDLPLYKFSFAHEYEADGLTAIGNNSNGGTFPLADSNELSVAFSQCLYEIRDFVIQDLKLTFTPGKTMIDDKGTTSIIENVSLGSAIQQLKDQATGSVTISIDKFHCVEIRKIMVDLLLPAISKRMTTKVLQISHSYIVEGERFDGCPTQVDVIRTGKLPEGVMNGQKDMRNVQQSEAKSNVFECAGDLVKVFLAKMMPFKNDAQNEVETQEDPNDSQANIIDPQNDDHDLNIDQTPTLPEVDGAEKLPDIDPLAHFKDQILTAIQYFNSMEKSLGSIQVSLNNFSVST